MFVFSSNLLSEKQPAHLFIPQTDKREKSIKVFTRVQKIFATNDVRILPQ